MDDFFWSDPLAPTQKPSVTPEGKRGWIDEVADPVKNAVKGGVDYLSQQATGGQYAAEQGDNPDLAKLFEGVSQMGHAASGALDDSISEPFKKDRDASVIPEEDQESVFSRNPLRTLVAKGSSLAGPAAVMMAFPASALAQMGVGAGMQVGAVIDASIAWTNELPDAELRKQAPTYDWLRDSLDEAAARKALHKAQVDGKDIAVAALTGAAGMGSLGRTMKGGVIGSTTARSAGAHAAEIGLGMGAMGADTEYALQRGKQGAGQQENLDWHRMMVSAFNSGAEGAVLGAGTGALHGGKGKAKPEPKPEVVVNDGPAPDVTEALTTSVSKPVDNIQTSMEVKPPEAPTLVPEAAPAVPEPVAEVPKTAPPAEPVAEVTPKVTDDTGQNIPESPATIDAQREQLANGDRKAVMYPEGTPVPPVVDGMKRLKTQRGVFDYDPKQIKPKEIQEASARNAENEILDLGPHSKPEIEQRIAAGEKPTMTAEVRPDGTNVREALGTEQTAPAQRAALEKVKSPDSVIVQQDPHQVLADRVAEPAKPRILAAVDPESVAKAKAADKAMELQLKTNMKQAKVADPEAPKVSHKGKDADAKRDADQAHAAELLKKFEPAGKTEDSFLSKNKSERDQSNAAIGARAQAAVAEANEKGTRIFKTVRDSNSNEHAWLAEAAALARKVEAGTAKPKDYQRFKTRDIDYRSGKGETARAERKIEGDEAFRKDQGDVNDAVGAVAEKLSVRETPEDILLKKEEGEHEVEVRERPKVEVTKEHVRTGEDKTGTFAVAKKRVIEIPGKKKVVSTRRRWGEYSEDDLKQMVPFARDINNLRKWLNELTDSQYKRLQEVHGKNNIGGWNPDRAPADTMEPKRLLAEYQRTLAMGDKYTFSGDAHNEPAFMDDARHHDYADLERELSGLEDKPREKIDVLGHETEVVGSTTVAEALKHTDGVIKRGISDSMYAFIGQRLKQLVGDVKVHVVSDADFDAAVRADNMRRYGKPGGNASAYYVGGHDHIVIKRSVVEGDANWLGHVLQHEAIHAATMKALVRNDKLRLQIRALMNHIGDLDQIMRIKEMRADSERSWYDPDKANRPKGWGSVEDRPQYVKDTYAWKNEAEFLAEVGSNVELQNRLTEIAIEPSMARALGLTDIYKKRSLWDGFVEWVRGALKLPPGSVSALEAALRVTERAMDNTERVRNGEDISFRHGPHFIEAPKVVKDITRKVIDRTLEKIEHTVNPRSDGDPKLMWARTADNLARAGDKLFGGPDNNPLRRVQELGEKATVEAQRLLKESEPVISKLHTLQGKYAGDQWQKFTSLAHDATIYNLHPDRTLEANKHLKKDEARNWQAQHMHAELARKFEALPDDLKAAWHEATAHFTNMQNEMSRSLISNVLDATGFHDKALAERVFNDTLTDADKKTLGDDVLRHLENVAELKRIDGAYFPLMRRGDYVVRGTHKVTSDARIVDGDHEFTSREQAKAFVERMAREGFTANARSVQVDKNTGHTYFTDEKGQVKVTKEDADAEQRWRVKVENQHVEFADTREKALQRAEELRKQGLEGVDAQHKREFQGDEAQLSSKAADSLLRSLRARSSYKDMTPTQRAELVTSLNHAALQYTAATGISARRLPRRGVRGASDDLVRNTLDYTQSVAGYLGRLKHKPGIEEAMREARKYAEDQKYESAEKSLPRTALINEFDKRLNSAPSTQLSKFSPAVQRFLTLSFIDKLASPSHSIINSTQTLLNTLPVLAGRHGLVRGSLELTKAYSAIGGARTIKRGFKNTGKAFVGKEGTEVGKPVRELLKQQEDGARLVQMFDDLTAKNAISADAGLELARAIKSPEGYWGVFDKGLGWAENVARAMPEAIEMNNRAASAVAAYRLEYARTKGDHAAATRYAYDTVNKTQFNYSGSNAPKWLQHPLAKLTLQFKKFAQGQYQLIAEQLNQALGHGFTKEERFEAGKVLAYHAAIMTIMGGALGLPTEPIKILLTVTQPVTGYGMDDFEHTVRTLAAKHLGKTAGEALTRGVTRVLPGSMGFDLSSRVGESDLMTFGMPKNFDKAQEWEAFFFRTLSGATASQNEDWIKGMGDIKEGDYLKGAEKILPFKTLADGLRAYRQGNEGKKSASGRQTLEPYNAQEMAVRTLGFTPAREAERSEMRGTVGGAQAAYKQERQKLIQNWMLAEGAAKARAMAAVSKFNQGKPKDAQIDMKDLTTAAKRRATEESNGTTVNSLRTTKRDRHIVDEMSSTYRTD